MKRAIVYVRASLDLTGEGRSVERQEEACRALCLARGWDVIGVEVDNSISAYGGKLRAGWQRVLAAVEQGAVDVVVAWHVDRMTRSMLDLEELIVATERHGAGIATAVGDIDLTTDAGRMVARILAAVARAEVERKAARQKLAHEQRAAAGKPWRGGVRPLGYSSDRTTVVKAEAEALRWAADFVLDGGPLTDIAREWQRLGLGPDGKKGGKTWSTPGVKNALVSPRYAGLVEFRGEPTGQMGAWEPIFDMETHLALRRYLLDPARTELYSARAGRKPQHLLSLLATCGKCGATLQAGKRKGRRFYVCSGHGCVTAWADDAEDKVLHELFGLLTSEGFRKRRAALSGEGVGELIAESEALRERLTVIGETFADGTIDKDTFKSMTRAATARLRELDKTIGAAQTGDLLEGVETDAERLAGQWEGMSLERRRELVGQLLELVAYPANERRGGQTRWQAELHLKVNQREDELAATG